MITSKQLGCLMSAAGIVAGLLSSWSNTWPRWRAGSLGPHALATELVLSVGCCAALAAMAASVARDRRRGRS